MTRTSSAVLLSLLALGAAPPSLPDEDAGEKRVRALVERLSDPRYKERETAQRALSDQGPKALPILNKIGPPESVEARSRLVLIRRELARRAFVPIAEEIRNRLAALPQDEPPNVSPLPVELERLIGPNQPLAGDLLLSVIASPEHKLKRQATNAFLRTWNAMTAEQIAAYLGRALNLNAPHRPRYPQGIEATIGMGYFFHDGCLPRDAKLQFRTLTTHYRDGKLHGRPFASEATNGGTGWVKTKDLDLGKHTIRMVVQYQFSHRGATHKGGASKEFRFEIVADLGRDDLIAPPDRATAKAVAAAFKIVEKEEDLGGGRMPRRDSWAPQVTWTSASGAACGLHVPRWRVTKALPVDLCFDVEVHDTTTGLIYPGHPLVLRRGQTKGDDCYCYPTEVRDFARGRSGFVPVKIVLRPLRALALTSPEITRYYPETIRSGVVRIKVSGDE